MEIGSELVWDENEIIFLLITDDYERPREFCAR